MARNMNPPPRPSVLLPAVQKRLFSGSSGIPWFKNPRLSLPGVSLPVWRGSLQGVGKLRLRVTPHGEGLPGRVIWLHKRLEKAALKTD